MAYFVTIFIYCPLCPLPYKMSFSRLHSTRTWFRFVWWKSWTPRQWTGGHCPSQTVPESHDKQTTLAKHHMSSKLHQSNFWPLWIGINSNQKHGTLKWSREIQWTRCHGQAGHINGCSGTTEGACLTAWQDRHVLPAVPTYYQVPANTYNSEPLTSFWSLQGDPCAAHRESAFLSFCSMKALYPQGRHPSSTVKLIASFKEWLRNLVRLGVSKHLTEHPVWCCSDLQLMYRHRQGFHLRDVENLGVWINIWGNSSQWEMWKSVCITVLSRTKLNLVLVSWKDHAHLCNLAAARWGIPFLGPRIAHTQVGVEPFHSNKSESVVDIWWFKGVVWT